MDPTDSESAPNAGRRALSAGAALKSARESAGMSVDAVAQQLKLAPRQVRALEEDDFEGLPGRTFVRGFARNYARFLQLDPDAVLALMPAPESTPALERPTLAGAGRPMGEIPVERARQPRSRWVLALLLAGIVGVAGYYEYERQFVPQRGNADAASGATPGPATAPHAGTSESGGTSTPLPNPIPDPVPSSSVEPNASTAAQGAAVAPPSGVTPAPAGAAAPPAPAPMVDTSLVLTFRGTSWAEVKDASGRVILQITGGAGMTQTVSGTPPLELALGNARDVGVTFRGQALDLAPYTRGGVARVALK
jgi:cytoskeleton protein RodZ